MKESSKGNHTRNSTAIEEGNVSAHEGDAVAGKALGLGVLIKFFLMSGHHSLSSIHPFLNRAVKQKIA